MSSSPSGRGLLRNAANVTEPRSKKTWPWLSRSADVTASTPVFRLRSSSWNTSWIPSSRSGPSMGMDRLLY